MEEYKICHRCSKKKHLISCGTKYLCGACINEVRGIYYKYIGELYPLYNHMSMESFNAKGNEKPLEACKNFATRKITNNGLLLFSRNAGNGKTHIAISTLRLWISETWVPDYDNDGFSHCFKVVTEPSLFEQLTDSYKPDSGTSEADILTKYRKAYFLVVDDVGKNTVQSPDFTRRIWFSIIDARQESNKLTVITSNKSGDELKSHLGEYAFDRLRGMTKGKVVEIKGESRR